MVTQMKKFLLVLFTLFQTLCIAQEDFQDPVQAEMIYEQNLQLDVADEMRTRCKQLLDVALRSLALDVDGDGVIDEVRYVGGARVVK